MSCVCFNESKYPPDVTEPSYITSNLKGATVHSVPVFVGQSCICITPCVINNAATDHLYLMLTISWQETPIIHFHFNVNQFQVNSLMTKCIYECIFRLLSSEVVHYKILITQIEVIA